MYGLAGDDWYFVDTASDQAIEADGGGNDRIFASVGYTLYEGSSIEILSTNDQSGTAAINLYGNAVGNTLYGNAGANILDGRGGADVMYGLGGDDWYLVDNASDQAIESPGGGADRIFASVDYTLYEGSSIEILSTNDNSGTAAINLYGNAVANTLYGNNGANILDGRGGADTIYGLGGNDWFYIDNTNDEVIEFTSGGSDRVLASVTYTLAAGSEVEILSTNDNGATAAIDLTGNEIANTLIGNAGANVLNGGGGNDVLYGLGGADMFAFSTAPGTGNVDVIADFQAGLDKIALDDAIFSGIANLAAAFRIGAAAQDADDRIIYNPTTGALFYDADGNGAGAAIQFATLSNAPTIGAGDFIVI